MNISMYGGFSAMLEREGIEYTADWARKLGFSSVEHFENVGTKDTLDVSDFRQAGRIRRKLEAQGLYMACYSVYANAMKVPLTEETLKRAMEFAAEMGSPYFHHTLLPWSYERMPKDAPDFQEGIKRAVDLAVKIADYGKQFDIVCIYEDQGDYVNGVQGFGAFYWELKKHCTNVGVCADFGNILFVDETPEVFLQEFQHEICHVHVKDYQWDSPAVPTHQLRMKTRSGRDLCDAAPGSGIIDFDTCMKILNDSGYRGAYALEISDEAPFAERAGKTLEFLRQWA